MTTIFINATPAYNLIRIGVTTGRTR